jgi:hypothetical protein
MNRLFLLLIPLVICCCTTQNQLILDPFDKGESLMICDETAIAEFETLMADIGTPGNEYEAPAEARNFFNSPDVLSTYQDTQPILGICRSGEKEYYYHIEKDHRGRLITDLDKGVTDYVVSKEKYNQIKEFIALHTPAQQEEIELEDGLNESDIYEDEDE